MPTMIPTHLNEFILQETETRLVATYRFFVITLDET